ncbi:MAG TPA: DUF2269 family protein [Gammaproteobacteria bacterium]|nr:DUF2269 family protein [Gammaproteobacteria bacterium]
MGLFVVAVASWLPVVWLQLRMGDAARAAALGGAALPAVDWRYLRWWITTIVRKRPSAARARGGCVRCRARPVATLAGPAASRAHWRRPT